MLVGESRALLFHDRTESLREIVCGLAVVTFRSPIGLIARALSPVAVAAQNLMIGGIKPPRPILAEWLNVVDVYNDSVRRRRAAASAFCAVLLDGVVAGALPFGASVK